MTRRTRRGLRDRWVWAVLASDVGTACKLMLMLFAHRMNAEAKVSIPRAELAALLGVHPQRVSERIAEAKAAGLLDQVDGSGHRSTVAQYVAVLPDCLPLSGNQSAKKGYRSAVTNGPERLRVSGNLSRPAQSDWLPPSGKHNARALKDRTQQRTETERDSRTSNASKDGIDEEAPARSPIAAVLREQPNNVELAGDRRTRRSSTA